jgi:hypothetical protein
LLQPQIDAALADGVECQVVMVEPVAEGDGGEQVGLACRVAVRGRWERAARWRARRSTRQVA